MLLVCNFFNALLLLPDHKNQWPLAEKFVAMDKLTLNYVITKFRGE